VRRVSTESADSLNPQPSTLNPKPHTPNPKPLIQNPKPSTLDPKAGSSSAIHNWGGGGLHDAAALLRAQAQNDPTEVLGRSWGPTVGCMS
jgi:hypothetical protein